MIDRPSPPARRLRPQLLDASGGLGYHLRALRYRALWQEFIACVSTWLESWQPPAEHLVLIGPSAGYALNPHFLARFRRITVLEPDPLARLLLRRRFPLSHFDARALDCLADRDGPTALAHRFPDAALLFANVLGQSPALAADPGWHTVLRAALRHHHWASWHDVLSATVDPATDSPLVLAPAADIPTLAGRLWRWPAELTDHDTFGLVGRQHGLALWHLAPQQWQLVEWGIHHPDAGLGDPATE